MTLAELVVKAQQVGAQLNTSWVPLKDESGNDVDIDFEIITEYHEHAPLTVSHVEMIRK